MSAIPLIASALAPRDPPGLVSTGICCVLGTAEDCVEREHAIKPSFTNLDLLRAPDSDLVSVRAWRVLTHSAEAAEGKKRDTYPLMQSSWLVTPDGLQLLDRQGVRRAVIEGTRARQWAGYATTSYKKHGALRAPLNTGSAQRWLFEMDLVDCSDRTEVADWWECLRATREAGIPRPVIETLDCSLHLMSKHTALWRKFEAWARPKVNAPLYRFLTYLLPSEEEIRGKQD